MRCAVSSCARVVGVGRHFCHTSNTDLGRGEECILFFLFTSLNYALTKEISSLPSGIGITRVPFSIPKFAKR